MPRQIDVAIARLTNKEPQVFSIGEHFGIYTTWRHGGSTPGWVSWQRFPGRLKVITAAAMADRRPARPL